jgi:xylulokinase
MEVTALEVGEAGCLGAAMLAGQGCGLFDDLDQVARRFVREKQTFEPNPRFKARYDEKFELYKQVYGCLADLHHRM